MRGTLTREQFQTERHISVTTYGIAHEALERSLQASKIRRTIAIRLPSFFGIGEIVAATDYLAVVPGWFSQIFPMEPFVAAQPKVTPHSLHIFAVLACEA